MARAQGHVFPPPLSDAYRIHHCRYVFIRCPAQCTTDQLVICIGVAFFDSTWSQSVYPFSLDRNVNSIFFRPVNVSSSSSRYAPPSSWPYVPVCWFLTTVAAVMNNFPSGPYHPDPRHLRQEPLRAIWHGLSLGSSGRHHWDLLCVLSM
jgi:hypothetical protein